MTDWFRSFEESAHELGVDGRTVRTIMDEVREETSRSGDTPVQAYGPPALYARAVAETSLPEPSPPTGTVALALMGPLAGMIGWQLGSRTIRAALDGTDITVTGGDLVWWAVLLFGSCMVVLHLMKVLRNSLVVIGAGAALVALAVLAGMYLQAPLTTLPLVAAGFGAVLFLAVSVFLWTRSDSTRPPAADPLVRLAPWTFPVLTLVQGLLIAVLHAAG